MLPIVFVHTGTGFYMPTTLLQAAAVAPRTDRFLLGDWGGIAFNKVTRRMPVKKYWKRAGELGRVFVNFSSNAAGFELVCLQRWLALSEWMRETGLDECLYLDSDVMLYTDPDLARRTVPAGAGMTVSGISGHTNFIGKRAVLEQFGDFILDRYTRPHGIDELAEEYRIFQQGHSAGGISDMSFFTWFRQANPGLVADLSGLAEGPTGLTSFDVTMDYAQGCRMQGGLKAIDLSPEGQPFATTLDGRRVRFHTLHFQGAASKQAITQYATTPVALRRSLELRNARVGLAYRAWRRLNRR